MTIGSSVNSFFQEHGITGNSIVDGLIIANLIPIFVSYINTVTSIVIKFFKFIFNILFDYVKYYLHNKLVGKKVCNIIIEYDSVTLFKFIDEHILTNDDVNSDNSFDPINDQTLTATNNDDDVAAATLKRADKDEDKM